MARAILAVLAIVSGCYATVYSSSAHLTAQQSTAAIPQRVGAATAEVVRLFAARSITLVDEQPLGPGDGRLLRLIGGRRHAGGEGGYGERHTIDSVYYARVEPTVTGASVSIVGKPAIDGVDSSKADEALADSVDGYQEAQVIYNLLVELRLSAR